jgi:hypothetical protein
VSERRVIKIFTLTMGGPMRELYLKNLIFSMEAARRWDWTRGARVSWIVYFQGATPSDELQHLMAARDIHRVLWPENVGRAIGQQLALADIGDADIILRTDDDARILERNFLSECAYILDLVPDAFIHAFPVGLTSNVGGCRGSGPRLVMQHPVSNVVYTLRNVPRMGGLARAATPETWRKIPWYDDLGKGAAHIESLQLAKACAKQGIKQYYAENRWVVEHQDSTDGQKWRKKNP